MKKRLLNCVASDFLKMSKDDLFNAIKASEGRTILSENISSKESVGIDTTSSEVARAFGADLILLNGIDLFDITIYGLEKNIQNPIKHLKKLLGRPVGVNLEPIDLNANMLENILNISVGRTLTEKTLLKANELGFDFICLTGNPATGVTNNKIIEAIKLAKKHFNGLVIAGKMHGSGVNEKILDQNVIKEFIESGADIILLPAIGTIPGITLEKVEPIISYIHEKGKLAMSSIGTSQESAKKETIREIAIINKMAGFDIQHIGDGGFGGLAIYDNILELSIAIRGLRHTIRMISTSINR